MGSIDRTSICRHSADITRAPDDTADYVSRADG